MEEIVLFQRKQEAHRILAHLRMRTLQIRGKPYGVVRINEDIYLFDKHCPHASYDLTCGTISPLGKIVCPLHNYQFSLNNGDELESRCKALWITKAYLTENQEVCVKMP